MLFHPSPPDISLRSGMFKHHKVVPITAAKRESKEPLRTKTIDAIPTGMVTRMAIRQMLAAARSHQTQSTGQAATPRIERTNASEDPLHAPAQL
jgi:hypothetical protein